MKFERRNENLLFERLALIIISVLVFLTMYYYDNQTMFVEAINNMHRIAEGKWYYILNGWAAIPYGVILQGITCVWAVPVFILSEMEIVSVTSIGARLWYKLFMLLFLILSTKEFGELASKMGIVSGKRIVWLKLFFLSSLLVVLPAVHVAQIDIVYLYFILKGITFYLNDDHYKFLICFMIAIPGKYIPLFIFLPLVLLREKRYWYIIRDVVVGCALCVVDRAMQSIGYRVESRLGIDLAAEIMQNNTMQQCFDELLGSDINIFGEPISLVFCAFLVLCLWCYQQKSVERNKLAIWVSFMGFSILFALGVSTPYWIIVLIPFEILLIFINYSNFYLLFPLETFFSLAYVYVYVLRIPWIFGSFDTFDFLLFKLIPGYEQSIHGSIADFIKLRGLDGYGGVAVAVLVVCIFGIAQITYPLKKEECLQDEERENNYLVGWYWIRVGIIYIWVMLNVWVVAMNHVTP